MTISSLDYRKNVPFQKLAKWRRKGAVIELNNKISKYKQIFNDNRNFYTHHLISSNVYKLEYDICWCDAYIPSKKYNDIRYLISICTTNKQLHEEIDDLVINEVYDESDQYEQDDYTSIPIYDPKFGKCYKLEFKNISIPIFDGRTRYQEIKKRTTEKLEEFKGTYQIYENWIIHPFTSLHTFELKKKEKLPELNDIFTFKEHEHLISHYYVMINAVLDVKSLTVETLNEFIQKFYDNDELSYISSTPVSQDHLNYSQNWIKEEHTALSNIINKEF